MRLDSIYLNNSTNNKSNTMTLNYQTLAFVMDIPTKEANELLKIMMNQDKVTTKDLIMHSELIGKFGTVRSVDPRYDGMDKFNFYLDQRRKSYRNYLNEKSCIKHKSFTGKFKIFYQLLTQEELNFSHKVFEEKHNFLYKKKL